MKRLKAHLLFTLPFLLVAAIAGYFSILYQLDFLDSSILDPVLAQLGSVEVLILVYVVQIVGYAAFCGFFGHILADKLGLMKPLVLEKLPLMRTCIWSIGAGIVLALDYWTFGAWIPGLREVSDLTLSLHTVMASVLYGGIVEELMLRLFFMSLVAWLLWKLLFRRSETVPARVLVAANVVAALIFAAGHLPATALLFGSLTPMLLFRCFLLNGGFGLLFGRIYRKYGIQYAMVAHALAHIVSKLIWFLFV